MGYREVWEFILEYMLLTAALEFLSLADLKTYFSSGNLFNDFLGETLLHVLELTCLKSPNTCIQGITHNYLFSSLLPVTSP